MSESGKHEQLLLFQIPISVESTHKINCSAPSLSLSLSLPLTERVSLSTSFQRESLFFLCFFCFLFLAAKSDEKQGGAEDDFAKLLAAEADNLGSDGRDDESDAVLMDLMPPDSEDVVEPQSLSEIPVEQSPGPTSNSQFDPSGVAVPRQSDADISSTSANGVNVAVSEPKQLEELDENAMQDDVAENAAAPHSVNGGRSQQPNVPSNSSVSPNSAGRSVSNGSHSAAAAASSSRKPATEPGTAAGASGVAAMQDVEEASSASPNAPEQKAPKPSADLAAVGNKGPELGKNRRYLGAIRPGHIREAHRRVRARGCGGTVRYYGLDDPMSGGSKGGSHGAPRSLFKW